MGDAILKKYFLIAAVLVGTLNLFGDNSADIARYDRYFNEISEVRVGIPNNEIDKLSDPFAVIRTANVADTSNVTSPTFQLNAILENKVKINDSWLKQGSLIHDLRVIAIKQKSVVLGNENKRLELFLREKNENSIITTN
ncbi:MAG: hypothetical protein LBF13_04725 [Campylobacteraceae bacterium]|jgi:hypothetical protein|nr:hypothetical protein [Campylobacteraceae bacterium]